MESRLVAARAKTHRAHRRFRAGAYKAQISRSDGQSVPNTPRQLHLEFGGHAVAGSAAALLALAKWVLDNLGMSVAENQRSPRTYVVYVFILVSVPQAGVCRAIDNPEDRRPRP